jgi:uncharacterized Zn-finger protein
MASKQPTPETALKSPTSTNNPGQGKLLSHICKKCDQQFPSKEAMKEHRDALSHNTMFSCEPCDKKFESLHAVALHEQSRKHVNKLAQVKITPDPSTQKVKDKEKGKGKEKMKVCCSTSEVIPVILMSAVGIIIRKQTFRPNHTL